MTRIAFEGRAPQVDPTAFIAPTASLVGDVTVEAGASVWYGAVLRGDYAPIVVRAGANVQDGAVLHAPPGSPVEVGPGATVAHNCVVHGAVFGEELLDGQITTPLRCASTSWTVQSGQVGTDTHGSPRPRVSSSTRSLTPA
jgi:carbonic anhydrase/acetyltransferase-like protein (isoleucine patch superfamily)